MEQQTGIQPQSNVVRVTEILPSVAPGIPVPSPENADGGGEPNRSWLSVGLVAAAGVLRMVSPIPNCTPIGALGLFGGGRLRSWQAFALPLLVMGITDALKVIPLAYQGYPAVNWVTTPLIYGSFLVNVLLGRWLCRGNSPLRIGLAALLASLQFFLVTNFADWLSGINGYPYTLQGLLTCYAAGLPFYRGTLIGDLLYSAALFGSYALVARLATAPKARLVS